MAVVQAAHGVRGAVKLKLYTENDLTQFRLKDRKGEIIRLKIIGQTSQPDTVLAIYNDVQDRTLAERLVGTEIFVERAELPELAQNEFYHHDLIGLLAKNREGEVIGKINAIHNFGAGDLLEVVQDKELHYIPINDQHIIEVKLLEGFAVIQLPEEL